MKCPVCRNGESRSGTDTLTPERGLLTMVVRHVRAEICDNCGEENADQATTGKALIRAEIAARRAVTVEVREFAAA